MAEIIDSLKRLERAGSEHSRATEKLHEAVRVVARLVEEIVPDGMELPRGYQVRAVSSNVGTETFLTRWGYAGEDYDEPGDAYVDGTGGYLHGDFSCPIPAQSRGVSLAFAHDVATGWLTELAEWLEKRAAEDAEATATLIQASEKLAK